MRIKWRVAAAYVGHRVASWLAVPTLILFSESTYGVESRQCLRVVRSLTEPAARFISLQGDISRFGYLQVSCNESATGSVSAL